MDVSQPLPLCHKWLAAAGLAANVHASAESAELGPEALAELLAGADGFVNGGGNVCGLARPGLFSEATSDLQGLEWVRHV